MRTEEFGGLTRKEATELYNATVLGGAKPYIWILAHKSNNTVINLYEDDIALGGGVIYTSILNEENDLKYGSIVSNEIIIHFIKNANTDLVDWSKEISISFGVEINGSIRYSTLISVVGNTPNKVIKDNITTLVYTGYDYSTTLDAVADDFVATLSFPMTIGDIRTAFETYYSMPLTSASVLDDRTLNSNPFPQGCTKRTIIKMLAEAKGVYAKMYANNASIGFIDYSTPPYSIDYTLTPDDYFQLNLSDISIPQPPAVCAIDTVDSSNNASYPSTYSGVPYNIVGNNIINNLSSADKDYILQSQYNKMDFGGTRPVYIPMSVSAVGNWLVEAGDIINIQDTDGTVYPMRIFSRILKWDGYCEDYYECTGNLVRQELTESDKQQYYLDGRYVGKNQLGDAAECDVANNLTTTTEGKVLDARQGKVLDDRIARVTTVRSLVTPKNATSAVTSVSTYDGRKFSDHHTLVFILRDNASSSTIRNAITIPASIWQSGQMLYLIQNHGTNLENRSGITFSYESDTSIKVVTNGSAALTGFEIIGYFNPT